MHLLLLPFLLLLAACGDSDDAASSGDTTLSVARSERVWTDTARSAGAAPERRLRVLLWQPEPRRERPLVILAHGFGGLPEKFDAFARDLALAGYAVAAPAFPLTNQEAPGGHESNLGDVVNQPADLTFVLDRLIESSLSPGDPLEASFDATRIAVLGHSLGGQTAIALTRKQCCRDARVGASILVAPLVGLSQVFGPDAAGDLPTLIVHGTADQAVAYSVRAGLYDSIGAPRVLVGVSGAGHSPLVESQAHPPIAERAAAERVTISFLDWVRDGEGLQDALADLAEAGHIVEQDLGD